MRDVQIATAQFEHRDGDKKYNLGRIRDLTHKAAEFGAEMVCFHECSITVYTFLQTLNSRELDELAEGVPDGPSTRALIEIARESGVVVMAGLVEREPDRPALQELRGGRARGAARPVSQAPPVHQPAPDPGPRAISWPRFGA